MTDFVLIHGAWHGGWCWKPLKPLLEARGHRVWAPSMTGAGDRVHLLTPDITADIHVTDIVNLMEYEDLSDVVLAGHSYGGLVAAGVASRLPERIRHVAVLDGAVPKSGEAMFDLFGRAVVEAFQARIRDGFLDFPSMELLGLTEPADQEWTRSKMTLFPLKCFSEPLVFDEQAYAEKPKLFVRSAGAAGERPLSPSAKRARDALDWDYSELPTGHNAMVTMPDEVAGLLLPLAD